MSSSQSGGHAVYPAPPKDSPTTPPAKQQQISSRIDERRLSLRDFQLPGLGEPGDDCGSSRMPEKHAICPNGDAVRYEPLRCRRVACPDCYKGEDRDQAFRISVELEAASVVRGERPHGVVFSVPPAAGRTYSIDDINTKLFRRGYRRARRQSDIEGGYAFFHPARIPDDIKARLRSEGYGPGGSEGLGYWEGVRADALDLGDWRAYADYSPHGHTVGFPGYIQPHEGDDYIVHKYTELSDVTQVVNHVRYLMTHRGTFDGDGVFRAIRPWGLMHHAASGWDGAEQELDRDQYAAVAESVAGVMGGEWSDREGLHYPDADRGTCPSCGTPKRDFIDLWDLTRLTSVKRQGGEEWVNRLTWSQRAFFDELVTIIHGSIDGVIYEGDVKHPDGVAVWVDGDTDPPPHTQHPP